MSRRSTDSHRVLVLAAALAASAAPRVALGQAPRPAAAGASRQVFNEVFLGQPAAPGFVVLSEGLVYRIEIEPATAQVSVRVARHMSLPPLLLVPLSDASGSAGGAAYLMVPRTSDEYRLDVTSLGDAPVRVRIAADSAEGARWALMREASRNQRPAGISLRAVLFDAFPSAGRDYADTTATSRGWGLEACLALLPHSAWLQQSYGGCVLSITLLERGAGAGNAVFLSLAPRVELLRSAAGLSLSIGAQVGLGATTSATTTNYFYLVAGGGGLVGVPVPGTGGHLALEGEIGVVSIKGSTVNGYSRTSVVPKLGLGIRYAL